MKLRNRFSMLWLMVMTLALLCSNWPTRAQFQTGSIFGTVTDEMGAALPAATVTVTGDGLSQAKVELCDVQGGFALQNLPPGDYTVKVELEGFSTVELQNVRVRVGRGVDLKFTLNSDVLTEEFITVAETPIINNAVNTALADPDINAVVFNLPPSDASYNAATDSFQINLQTALPIITKSLTFYNASPAKIEFSGANLSPDAVGLQVNNANIYLMGFHFTGFGTGIAFSGSIGGSVINDCAIVGNRLDGVRSDGVSFSIFNSLISANGQNGIALNNVNAGLTLIQGNYIGTDRTGRSIDPDGTPNSGDETGNRGEGMRIVNSSNVMIGGANPAEGNTVGGNGDGMSVINSRDITIQASYFGTNPFGDRLRNFGAAIGLAGDTNNVKIGGDGFSTGNTIANNGHGIIAFPGTFGNRFLFNKIFSNTGLGINLNFPNGVDTNDPLDGDGGANGSQNRPVFTSAVASDSNTIIRGMLNSTPTSDFLIQYFLTGLETTVSGGFEGQMPLGSRTVTTDASGIANVDALVPTPLPGGFFITGLATHLATGNTSEYSDGVAVSGSGRPDLEVSKSGAATLSCGEEITYTITVHNRGTASATSVSVIDDISRCFLALDGSDPVITTSQGTAQIIRATNSIFIDAGKIDPGASVTITIKSRFIGDCAASVVNAVRAITEGDSNPANNISTVPTTVTPCPKITDVFVVGKNVIVEGSGFKKGDVIEINGTTRNTKFLDFFTLKAKKGIKSLLDCDPTNPGKTNQFRLIRSIDGAPVVTDTAAFATCP